MGHKEWNMKSTMLIALLAIVAGVAFADKEVGMDRGADTNADVRIERLDRLSPGAVHSGGHLPKEFCPRFHGTDWERRKRNMG